MNISKRKIPVILTAMIILLLHATPITSVAEEKGYRAEEGEIVFLLDTSGSMKTQDEERLAIDAIRQGAYSLPSNYKPGFVAYGTDIQTSVPLDIDLTTLDTQLSAIQYTGYTNAGAGLSQAMGLFSTEVGVDRYIILLTDGEIDMPDASSREFSRTLYQQMAQQAKERGVKIYITAIGSELNNPQMHIFDAAEITDGAIYWEGASGSLSQIMEKIVADRLNFPKQVLETAGEAGSRQIEVPPGTGRMKLFLQSDTGVGNVTADYQALNGKQITGQRFAVIEMVSPSSETVQIHVPSANTSIYKTVEYTVSPAVHVTYRFEELPRTEEEIKKQVPPVYEHYADIVIQLTDIAGDKKNIWEAETFEGREIAYTINGAAYTGIIESGQISKTIPADEISQIEVVINPDQFDDAIYFMEQPVSATIEKIPDPVFVKKTDYRPLWAILGVLATAILTLLILWAKKSRTTVIYMAQPPATKEPAKKVETRSCTYSGKFNMYVVRTADGRDIPPQTYRLFGRNSARMTLDQILTGCKIKFGNIGADDIIFYPGPEYSVIIMDQSERCTTLRGTEILKKGMGYPLYYGEKLTITFEDEATEIEIHYKSLKPSEREV